MSSPDPQLVRKWAQSLPQVLQTFREICDTLNPHESSLELKNFYLHMSAWITIIFSNSDEFASHLAETPVSQQLLHSLGRVLAKDPNVPVTNDDHSALLSLDIILEAWCGSLENKLRYAQDCLDFGSKKRRDELINCLEEAKNVCQSSSKAYRVDVSAEQDLYKKTRRIPPLDIWPLAQSVYSALDSSNTGPCDICKISHGYGARLCIETYRAQRDVQGCDFDMFLGLDQLWREARIRPVKKSVVKFTIDDGKDDHKKATSSSRSAKGKTARVKSLCQQIKEAQKRWMLRLNFEVKGNELWKIQSERSKFGINASDDVVSLSHFITKQPQVLNGKTKRILAVLLGYAVLHLYGTEWLQPTLCSDDILFFKTSGAVPLKPYLQVRIKSKAATHCPINSDDEIDEEEEDEIDPDDELVFHPYPCLVSLALLLIELHQAVPIETIAEGNNLTLSDDMTNEDRFFMAGQIFLSCQDDFEDQTRMAIDACLDPAIGRDHGENEPDKDTLRTTIYQNIVRRLEDELEQGHSYISIEGLDSLAQTLDFARFGRPIKPEQHQNSMLSPAGHEPRASTSKRNRHGDTGDGRGRLDQPRPSRSFETVSDHSRLSFFDGQGASEDITVAKKKAYAEWKSGVIGVYDRYAPDVTEDSRVKIVVLDTGVDKNHLDFDAYEDRIKASVSYVGNNRKSVRDTSGHGTHVTSLLCEYAPDADIYIVKIAEYDPVSSSIIAQAIDDAVKNWQPDIITMSFGWPARDKGYESLEKAIKNAHSNDVLLFAAASNDGANANRAWPARHSGVICVHSTTADGNPSPFNPVAIRGDNFAVVGEAVQGAWPQHLCDTQVNQSCLAHKSGTSFATPIAAGIAAFLLQYARSKLGKTQAARLRRFEGMATVLRRISVEKQGYNYIAPRLHPDNFFGKSEEFIQTNLHEALS
ncbi:hypothetical protein FSARC_4000 [Fusarium sarcochroum]|uniref:Peptidase S8/S53 domain-containing protein n=1 Tax=Fusarium sarcochroum TaxID=1208366 RepID=A0A8H4U2E5_9HYPO|nr:hypothetical protein FSARC_4000 [Fusarium sarcochroum]